MGFQQGLSGLSGAARNLEVIGNNVANASTVGFKSSRAQFADVYANTLAGSTIGSIGIGTRVSGVAQMFTQGNVTTTNNPLDVAINGEGFYRLSTNGTISYSRNGQFQLDNNGYIVSNGGARLTGFAADAAGNITTGTPVDLRISRTDLPPLPTSTATAGLNLDSRKTALTAAGFNLANAATYHGATSLSTYDSLGNAHTLSLYFVKTAANTYSVFAANDGVQVGAAAVGSLVFQSDGSLDTTATTLPFNLSVPLPATSGATTTMTIALDFTGTTQFGTAVGVNELNQNGYTAGKLGGFGIGADGVIVGRYSNGQTLAQGQIALTSFSNSQGLAPLGNNQWAETSASGLPLVGAPGAGVLGALQAGAVEEANVDLTQELVNMITAQRIYQANAQTIKTEDSLMQTIVNLR
ncbi:MAG: flagellar hook protein FlgE [Betaproteobacteria bacterium]|nr:flagellar hook protein FlgE [Betaproteobacteria bacterium]